MSIFRSISQFITKFFSVATATVGTVEKSLDIANHFVEENHKAITKKTTVAAQMSVAAFNEDVAQQLNASASLKAQYDQVVADW